jgi:AcrR family transcriptional regulator
MPRRGLDSARVIDEAGQIADAEGLGAVTLARVAMALGVRPPSLYNHVEGLPGLLRRLTLRSIGDLTEVIGGAAIGRSGAEALRAVGRAYRAFAHEHPGRYAATVRAPGPSDVDLLAAGARAVEVLTAVLGAWGFAGDAALHRVRVMRAALHGFVTLEAHGGFGLPLDLDQSFELVLDTLVAGLDRAPVVR